MLYITGDVHGGIHRRIEDLLTDVPYSWVEENALIVCGDFGLPFVGDKKELRHIQQVNDLCIQNNFNIYYVCGNHENFSILYEYSIDADGYRVIASNIKHLQRGYLYKILGYDLFAFGGAMSTDFGWHFQEEIASDDECQRGTETIKIAENIDIIITHAAPMKILQYYNEKLVSYINPKRLQDPMAYLFEVYRKEIDKKFPHARWFNGHYHFSTIIPPTEGLCNISHISLYRDFYCIKNKK